MVWYTRTVLLLLLASVPAWAAEGQMLVRLSKSAPRPSEAPPSSPGPKDDLLLFVDANAGRAEPVLLARATYLDWRPEIAISPDRRMAACTFHRNNRRSVCLIELATRRTCWATPPEGAHVPVEVVWTPDNSLVVAWHDWAAHVLEVRAYQYAATGDVPGRQLATMPDVWHMKQLAVDAEGRVLRWWLRKVDGSISLCALTWPGANLTTTKVYVGSDEERGDPDGQPRLVTSHTPGRLAVVSTVPKGIVTVIDGERSRVLPVDRPKAPTWWAWSPGEGHLVGYVERSLVMLDVASGEWREVEVPGAARVLSARWLSDAIVYVSSASMPDDGRENACLLNLATGAVTQIVDSTYVLETAWGSGNNVLALATSAAGVGKSVVVFDAESRESRRVGVESTYPWGGVGLAWSPSGRFLTMDVLGPAPKTRDVPQSVLGVRVMDRQGGIVHDFDGATASRWAPGDWILFMRNDVLHVAHQDGTGERPLAKRSGYDFASGTVTGL